MLITYSYRLYPTATQTARLQHYLDVGRTLYNHGLSQRISYFRETGKTLTKFAQFADLTSLRACSQVLAAVPVWVERDALSRLDAAYAGFFRRVAAGMEKPGFPRFKGAGRWNSFSVLNPGKVIRPGYKVHIVGIGSVNARNVRQFTGKAKVLRIVRRAGKWFARVVVDDGQASPPVQPIRSAVGVDVGLSSFATLSTGEKVANPRFYRRLYRKLRRAARAVSRKAKGGSNHRKAVESLQRIHLDVVNQRSNFTHHLSKRLVTENQLIAVEALTITDMVRSRFAKSILDAAWGQFIAQLKYKAENAGVLFCAVNPRGTSQECSQCGNVVLKDLSVRTHECPVCGLVLDRDENAARNVLQRALNNSAPGADGAIGNACGGATEP